MSESLPNDPALESLAARLAACPPRVSDERSQELLYLCAYAAGRSAADRRTRRWQGVAALLTVLLIGMSIPLVNRQAGEVAHQPPQAPPSNAAVVFDQPAIPRAFGAPAPADADVSLSAWQQPVAAGDGLAAGLARYEQTDPALRSLAVARLSRSILD